MARATLAARASSAERPTWSALIDGFLYMLLGYFIAVPNFDTYLTSTFLCVFSVGIFDIPKKYMKIQNLFVYF
jgi:hypothetical protein